MSTFGADAVDAFYLVGPYEDPVRRTEVERAVLTAAGGLGCAEPARGGRADSPARRRPLPSLSGLPWQLDLRACTIRED